MLRQEDMNDINQSEIRQRLAGVLLTDKIIGKLPGCFYWRLHFIWVYLAAGTSYSLVLHRASAGAHVVTDRGGSPCRDVINGRGGR